MKVLSVTAALVLLLLGSACSGPSDTEQPINDPEFSQGGALDSKIFDLECPGSQKVKKTVSFDYDSVTFRTTTAEKGVLQTLGGSAYYVLKVSEEDAESATVSASASEGAHPVRVYRVLSTPTGWVASGYVTCGNRREP